MKKQENKKNQAVESKEGASPLLERYLQRSMTDRMQEIDDESLAQAIKTLLYEDQNKKHLH